MDRTIIIDAVIKVVVAVILSLVIPSLRTWLIRNKDNKELQLVLGLADIAVKSVMDDLKTESGQAKKQEALRRLVEQVSSWNVKGFTLEELDHYIATAYVEMEKNKLPEPVVITNVVE